MGTNLVINNSLMLQALKASGLASKKAVVEEGLRLLLKMHGQRSIRRFRGKIALDNDVPPKKGMK